MRTQALRAFVGLGGGASRTNRQGDEEPMFSHVMIGSNDIGRSRIFYDALFTAIGGKPGREDERGRLSYLRNGAAFMVTKPIDGEPACHANGGTIGFAMDSPEQVD